MMAEQKTDTSRVTTLAPASCECKRGSAAYSHFPRISRVVDGASRLGNLFGGRDLHHVSGHWSFAALDLTRWNISALQSGSPASLNTLHPVEFSRIVLLRPTLS